MQSIVGPTGIDLFTAAVLPLVLAVAAFAILIRMGWWRHSFITGCFAEETRDLIRRIFCY